MQDQKFKLQQKANFDRRHRMHLLPYIPDGTDVWITTDRADPIPGIVVGKAATPHSYLVDTEGGGGGGGGQFGVIDDTSMLCQIQWSRQKSSQLFHNSKTRA